MKKHDGICCKGCYELGKKAEQLRFKEFIEKEIVWLRNQKYYLNKRMGKYIFNSNCDKRIIELSEEMGK